MTSKAKTGESLGDVLNDILQTTRLSRSQIALRMGMSARTLGRYWIHGELPPVHRRHAFVHAMPELDLSLLLRLAAALDLPASVARGAHRAGDAD